MTQHLTSPANPKPDGSSRRRPQSGRPRGASGGGPRGRRGARAVRLEEDAGEDGGPPASPPAARPPGPCGTPGHQHQRGHRGAGEGRERRRRLGRNCTRILSDAARCLLKNLRRSRLDVQEERRGPTERSAAQTSGRRGGG